MQLQFALQRRCRDSPRRQEAAEGLVAFLDRFDGAFTRAGAAVDAFIGIDHILRVAFFDCFYGADILARSAHGASIGNHIRHNHLSFILRPRCGLVMLTGYSNANNADYTNNLPIQLPSRKWFYRRKVLIPNTTVFQKPINSWSPRRNNYDII